MQQVSNHRDTTVAYEIDHSLNLAIITSREPWKRTKLFINIVLVKVIAKN